MFVEILEGGEEGDVGGDVVGFDADRVDVVEGAFFAGAGDGRGAEEGCAEEVAVGGCGNVVEGGVGVEEGLDEGEAGGLGAGVGGVDDYVGLFDRGGGLVILYGVWQKAEVTYAAVFDVVARLKDHCQVGGLIRFQRLEITHHGSALIRGEKEIGVHDLAFVGQIIDSVCGRYNDAEVEAGALDAPEKVTVLSGRGGHDVTISRHEPDAEQSVCNHPVFSVESTDASAEGRSY